MDRDRTVTVWQQLETGYWVIERSYAAFYAEQLVAEANRTAEARGSQRRYEAFEKGVNPNG